MRQWFYLEDGEQRGPVSEDRLVGMFRSGQLTGETLVWTQGLEEWTPAHRIENLVPSPTSPPPLPALAAQAAAAGSDAMPQSESGPPPAMYLHIPITRLLLMSAVSLGLYEVYWIYKNWQYVKERDGLEIHPFWRAVFGIFFIYGIIDMIRNDEEMNNLVEANFSPGFLAAGWIALTVVSNLASRAENFTFSLIPYLLSYASVLFLVPVQAYVNRVNAMMQPRPAWARWSKGHIVCLIIGIIGWLLILLSALLPDVPA